MNTTHKNTNTHVCQLKEVYYQMGGGHFTLKWKQVLFGEEGMHEKHKNGRKK
jgi:hypothetical protein